MAESGVPRLGSIAQAKSLNRGISQSTFVMQIVQDFGVGEQVTAVKDDGIFEQLAQVLIGLFLLSRLLRESGQIYTCPGRQLCKRILEFEVLPLHHKLKNIAALVALAKAAPCPGLRPDYKGRRMSIVVEWTEPRVIPARMAQFDTGLGHEVDNIYFGFDLINRGHRTDELYLPPMNSWINKQKALVIPFLALYIFLVIRTSWASDDAIITFRSLENFLHGYGPVFNIGERVQTFTHPLWFLIQAAVNFIFNFWKGNPFGQGQMYFLNVFMSIGVSILMATIFALKVASSTKGAVLGLLIFSVSKAFIDYSTSGLENPLTHLILLLFILVYLSQRENSQRSIFLLALLAALGGVDRLDTLLFYFPALLILFWQSPDKFKTFVTLGLGLLPLVAWELFSLFYYGFPFPNTAYAKINTGIPASSLMTQGIYYYLNSLRMDPVTLLTIFVVCGVGLVKKNAQHRTIVAGILLYLMYTVYIGGDFMSGRYFSAPLLACTVLLSTMEFKSSKMYGVAIGLVLLIGIAPIYVVPERSPSFGIDNDSDHRIFVDEYKISDERIVYTGLGFFERLKKKSAPSTGYARDNWVYLPGEPVRVKLVGPLGMNSMTMGPNFHMIDMNSLADPLMTRMPLYDVNTWRIGHFRHVIPDGYLETLKTGENLIEDEDIALYYDKLSFVIKGDLWDRQRIIEIWNLNTGKYNHLLENVIVTTEE